MIDWNDEIDKAEEEKEKIKEDACAIIYTLDLNKNIPYIKLCTTQFKSNKHCDDDCVFTHYSDDYAPCIFGNSCDHKLCKGYHILSFCTSGRNCKLFKEAAIFLKENCSDILTISNFNEFISKNKIRKWINNFDGDVKNHPLYHIINYRHACCYVADCNYYVFMQGMWKYCYMHIAKNDE